MSQHKSEEEFIEEMKQAIRETTTSVAKKVNKSALSYMSKKEWIDESNLAEINAFFSEKIPKVLSEEISKELNTTLGLDLKL
ncbi:MAG: hypothetical protein O3A01_01845 [bacterium]|nr:hypothetical protein [bacterium]